MKRLTRHSLAATLLAVAGLAASAPTASANVEIGGTAGIHVFNQNNELGVADAKNATSLRNSVLFGLRLGYMFNDMLGVEGEVGIIPTEARQLVFEVWGLTYRGQIIAQFRGSKPENRVLPFVLVGAGNTRVIKSANENVIAKDTDLAAYVGIGAKYRVDNGWGLRFDGRVMFPPSSDSKSVTTDFEALISVYKEWGRTDSTAKIEDKKPEPVSDDPDGDGIKGSADTCPTEAEDKDGFQDEDGCPDLDNDGDGVADTADKCPMEPEDKDGFQDEDGCPEADNDADGIPDAADKCPTDAEDKDGFQDDDGCPDLDNDGDGVVDANDKCQDKPETKNGFEDGDGCPDELPKAIQKFSGTVKGINFKTGSAEIIATSNAVLDEAVKVLTQFTDLKIEIQGHTDDQKPGKTAKFQDNTALSQARADAVKAYIVGKGIADSRVSAKGYGDTTPVDAKKTAAARAKNRRVEFKLLSDLVQ
ncbi:MAG: OmpA family protein [Kofleriaceae bacterium]|nr:OmpA family protein [Kofleriaceae bacterium]